MMNTTLEFRWTVSRGRDSYGYNICSLYVNGRKVSSCNGGGYDMKGTALGNWLAREYADRLRKLRLSQFPENSHWEADLRAFRCYECAVDRHLKGLEPHEFHTANDCPAIWPECPDCKKEMKRDRHAGKRVKDGRGFYGLSFHDPDFDPGKAVIGKGCTDRTMARATGKSAEGKTVEQAEQDGESLGLERYQAFYQASAKTPSKRHRIPLIDGGCGFSSVEKIAEAIGLRFEWVKQRSKKADLYLLHDKRETKP